MKVIRSRLFSYIICMLAGMLAGLLLVNVTDSYFPVHASATQEIVYYLMMIVFVCLGFTLQLIMHEGGHILFGRLTGYRFISYRVGSLIWRRTDHGIERKKYSLAGTGGQALMEPPGNYGDDFPVVLYNMGGVLINLITAVLCHLLSLPFAGSYFGMFLRVVSGAGLFTAFLNGVPMSYPVPNDGFNTLELIVRPNTKKAFWVMMKSNAMINDGISAGDLPEEWFEIPGPEDMDNGIISYIPFAACDRLLNQGKYDEAEELRQRMLKECTGLPGIYRILMEEECLYYELTHENRPEVISRIYDKKFADTVKQMKGMLPVLRTECVKAKLFDKDEKKYQKCRAEYDKILKDYPYEIEKENDLKLLEDAISSAGKQ